MPDCSWDFKSSNTKNGNHGFHTYPAMIIPSVAKRIIDDYGKKSQYLCDPFMGSGTVLLEAKLSQNFKYAFGVDINPLAVLIAKVKTTPINQKKLKQNFEKILHSFSTNKERIQNPPFLKIPEIPNLEYWFKPNVIRDLTILKNSIEEISSPDYETEIKLKNFFNVSFSETIRLVSNSRNNEFKLYRITDEALVNFEPNVIHNFIERTTKNIERMGQFYQDKKKCKIVILEEDSRNLTSIPSNHFDLMITSPPYGDSKTTVAYGQFSRLSLEWLNYKREDTIKIDKKCLGGEKNQTNGRNLESNTLNQILDEIKEIDKKRSDEVKIFYNDFFLCLEEINRIMRDRSTICFVVGNRRIKGITIPTDKIIVELLESFGNYQHKQTIMRGIHNKRMPHKNSPTNIKGSSEVTMNKEYIVIIKKR